MRLVLLAIFVLSVNACGGGSSGSSRPFLQQEEQAAPELGTSLNLIAAVPSSPYASILEGCIKASDVALACTLGELPLINAEVFARGDSVPTIDDVMARTVVSHDWMAQNFRLVLEQMPTDMMQLFGGVTAIAIAADIRPSFYTSRTGAIYLDPASFWLTVAEKQTIDREADFRSSFGNTLNFVSLSRYVVGNSNAWTNFSLEDNSTRILDNIILPVADLLFHELAHANDIIPPTQALSFDLNQTVAVAAQSVAGQNTANRLTNAQPLNSQLLHDLGQVLFQGVTATSMQQMVSAQEVGLEFEVDGASDDYAYSSRFEDVAMLFEEVMMKYHFGVDRELAYTDAPATPNSRRCADYIVQWGFRNRLSDSLVRSRAEFVVQNILNRNDVAEYFVDFTSPARMIDGVDWCANLAMFGSTNNKLKAEAQQKLSTSGDEQIRDIDFRTPHSF